MDYFSLGSEISYPDYNAIVYLLRKFKRLTSDLKLGNSVISSDYGTYSVTGGLTSVGGNFILEDDVTISSSDVLLNCFYTFFFTVVDVNLSGTVNRRVISVTGDTGDNGELEVVLEPSLLESDEVILPDFKVDIVFDPHEYYTPVSSLDITLTVDKSYITVGETNTVTATVLDDAGTPVEDLELQFNLNGDVVTDVTDEDGVASIAYTGVSDGWVNVTVSGESIRFYVGEVTIAEVRTYGSSVTLGRNSNGNKQWLPSNGDVIIDWGDGTQSVVNNPTTEISHRYYDRDAHNITFIGNVTSLGEHCFFYSKELFSIDIADTVTSLGKSCFSNCTNLTSITIPDSVTTLESSCFIASGLTSINIPDSVTTIREACFMQCTDLVTVTIPDSVTTLNGQCFQSCTSLTSIVIPSSITLLKYFSFKDCTSLTSVTIPNSVSGVEEGCFDGCTSLIDYQLYWESRYTIVQYASGKMPNNKDTIFTIPTGTTSYYTSKNYPYLKLEERGRKKIVLSCSTPIIQKNEIATIIATYSQDGVPVSNERLSYEILYKGTIISTDSDTTDSNGQIMINYTGNSIGEVTVKVYNQEFSPFYVSNTYTLYDTVLYDGGTISNHKDIWTGATGALTRASEYSTFKETGGTDLLLGINTPSSNIRIEFDLYQVDGAVHRYFYQFSQGGTYRGGGSLYNMNKSANNWIHVVIDLPSVSGYYMLSDGEDRHVRRNMSWDVTNDISFRFWTAEDIAELRFKNFMVYSTGTPSPTHDYSLSIGGTSIIQTGDTDTITATLTDNGVVVSGETLSYEIKHGSTVIDSGSDTTDSNGEISISYVGTGVGDVDVIVSYGSLLQETYELEDCMKYYPLVDNSDESAFTIPTGTTVSYSDEGMRLSANAYKQIKLTDKLTSDCSVEFTVTDYSTPSNNRDVVIIYAYTNGETTPNQEILRNVSASTMIVFGQTLNRPIVKGAKYRIEYTSSTLKLYENDELLGTKSNNIGFPTRFEWHMGANDRYAVYKDLKVKAL